MGLLDGLAGQVLGSLSSSSGGQQGGGLVQAIAAMIAQHPGGIAGLIDEFQRGGLGSVAASWVGTGANLPISAEQLQSVLGGQRMQSLAAASGLDQQQAASGLAALFPQVVDQLTPNGTVPDNDSLGALLRGLDR